VLGPVILNYLKDWRSHLKRIVLESIGLEDSIATFQLWPFACCYRRRGTLQWAMVVRVMHIANQKTDWCVLLRRLAHSGELDSIEIRMLVNDNLIGEDIDLADGYHRFADAQRIVLPIFYAWHDKLIEKLTRVEHVSEPSIDKSYRIPSTGR